MTLHQATGQELVARYHGEIQGKVVLTTGVSPGGLGAHFLQTIAEGQPALLILAGRDALKTQATANEITEKYPKQTIKLLHLDLSSLAAVRVAAQEVLTWSDVPSIDILVNNAGIMAVPYRLSVDGYESQFAGNHLGHFLFTNLIMPKILASPTPRVVTVSSGGHRFGAVRFSDLNFDNGALYEKWTAYGQSKTANILFAKSLAQKLGGRGLLSFSIHPGAIVTPLSKHLDLSPGGDGEKRFELSRERGLKVGFTEAPPRVSKDQGIATHVFTCFAPNLSGYNGKYFTECKPANPYEEEIMCWATSTVEANRLWSLSESFVGQKFEY